MLNNDPMADKMALFRQNAADVAKKREVTSDSVKQAEHELKDLEKILKTKRSGLKDGDQPLKGQATRYTLDLLKGKDKEITARLMALEEQKGISGYFSMQEMTLNKVNDENSRLQSTDELVDVLKDLNDKINDKKQ
ncbi:unnamed protein product, partial [Oppiella nova]